MKPTKVMRCRVCKAPPVIELRAHNAAFCAEHLVKFCRDQVAKSIKKFWMFGPEARVLVAVSGGKDSLALWDILNDLGYQTEGLVIELGIGDYSEASTQLAVDFAEQRGLTLRRYSLRDEHDMDVPGAAEATKRVPCSACGLSKRHIFDAVAREGGFDVVATGHNLDDEAAVLFGNVMRWKTDYLARQRPVLEADGNFPKKVKPLVRLSEREMAAYCLVRGIDYIVDECPMALGNKHLEYKTVLNDMEVASPGSKHEFYFGYLDRLQPIMRSQAEAAEADESNSEASPLSPCVRCGAPSSNEICAFCVLVERSAGSAGQGTLVAAPKKRSKSSHRSATTTDHSVS